MGDTNYLYKDIRPIEARNIYWTHSGAENARLEIYKKREKPAQSKEDRDACLNLLEETLEEMRS